MAHVIDADKQSKVDNDILEKDYCPPLDTALFYAVLSDLDPGSLSSIQDVRQTLDSLKESAEIEQGTDFDPSGTAAIDKHDDTTASINLADLSVTENSGTTSITESSVPDSNIPEIYDEGIEELSDLEKTNLLLELCPEANLFDVQFTLKKYKGSFRKSLDETLNLLWIKNNTTVQKGVEGFFQETPSVRKRKGKNKSKASYSPEYESQEDQPPAQQNVWQIRKKQIEFIATRVQLSESVVISEYQQSGGSQRATILNLCKVDLRGVCNASTDDTVVQMNAAELGQDFPHLSSEQCLALIVLTYPFSARAHELAKAVFASSASGTSTPVTTSKLIPHYVRPQLDIDEADGVSGFKQQSKQQSLMTSLDSQALTQAAIGHAQLREQMFSKANAAWRKSRSNHLMGGAAAYYSDEGRKANASSRAFSSAVADAQIQGTATANSIDLHGVNVEDAVRNAKNAVQRWWNNGQAEWSREGKPLGGNGFTVITGAGTHSVGGKAKIRPAVVKMLKAEGWRVDEDSVRGQVVVLGRARVR